MSYDIELVDNDGEVVALDEPMDLRGGTFIVGGTSRAWFNITYNYSKYFYDVLGKDGIRSIYGKTVAETLPILEEAAAKLGTDTDPDYWKATEGNARNALLGLITLAKSAPPDSVWRGD